MAELEESSNIVIARLIKKASFFDKKKNPLNFIIRAMKNHSIDEHRKRVSQRKRETAFSLKAPNITYLECDTEWAMDILKADILDPLEEKLFTKIFQRGEKLEEVISELNISKFRCKKHLRSIEEKIRNEIMT